MDISLLSANNPAVLIAQMRSECRSYYDAKVYKEYNPKYHLINDKSIRPNKFINIDTTDVDGNVSGTYAKEVQVARIPIPLQRLIVSRLASFTAGGGVTLKPEANDNEKQKELFTIVANTWKNNKMDFKNVEVAESFMSETEVCEIWSSRKNNDGSVEMKCSIYKPSDGYDLIPVFDSYRDLIAFGLGFESMVANEFGGSIMDKQQHMDVYTKDTLTKYIKRSGTEWDLVPSTEEKPNPLPLVYGKIPVIYYSAKETAWAIVQSLIERYETLVSNFADTNDYNGSPILFASGEIKGMSSKGEAGKLIEGIGDGADLKYVNWEGAPEAIKLELETLSKLIFTCTQTPNISFDEMKSVGDISGVAFDRIMIDAHLKAKSYQSGNYGEGIQRRLNFLIYACAEITIGMPNEAKDLEIRPIFKLFRLNDDNARIQNAMLATGNQKIMPVKEGIIYAGVSDDVEETYRLLMIENKEQAAIENKVTEPIIPIPV